MLKTTRPQWFPDHPRGAVGRLAGLVLMLAPAAAAAAEPPRLTVVERRVAQDQGGWVVNYRLRYHGPAPLAVTPAEVAAKVEGWVSNSRVAAHAVPRWSSVVVAGSAGSATPAGVADVIAGADEARRCRERVAVQVWADGAPCPGPANASASAPPSNAGQGPEAAEPKPVALEVAPGDALRVRLRLEHLHVLYGDYDPLLGTRALELRLGPAAVRDALPLDREQYLAQPRYCWPTPPEDRRDTRHFVSAPDSLHLEAHVPGNQYYRFPERPVRYASKVRLRFWYFIACGTEGECRVRIAQYKDTPIAWKMLGDGGSDECLTTVGRWVRVERVFRTEPEATSLALDFRIVSPTEVGEMWIDDVRLEPLAGPAPGSP